MFLSSIHSIFSVHQISGILGWAPRFFLSGLPRWWGVVVWAVGDPFWYAFPCVRRDATSLRP